MGNSPEITVAVAVPAVSVETDLGNWDMDPKSGNTPFSIGFFGWLSRKGMFENVLDSAIVDGETIQLQIQGYSGWVDIGVAVITAILPSNGVHGFYSGQVSITAPTFSTGNYLFRTHYAGNTTKGLLGCEDGQVKVAIGEIGTGVNPLTAVAVIIVGIIGVGGAIYALRKKKK